MNIPLLIGSTAVLGSLLALWWAVTGARPARAGVDLGDVRRPADLDLRAATLQRDVGERTLEPLVARLAGLARRYTPRGRITGLEQRLLLAGASARLDGRAGPRGQGAGRRRRRWPSPSSA